MFYSVNTISFQAAVKTAAVDRLTDSAKYTGSHVRLGKVLLCV